MMLLMSENVTKQDKVQHQTDTDGIDLMEGESVLQNRHPGWTLWWKQIALSVLVLLGGVGGDAAVGGLLISAIIFGYVIVSRMQSRYIVTDERVKAKVGLLSKETREYRIGDINSLSTSQSLFERIFGHGSIEVRTASNTSIVWHGVPKYKDVANSIREQQRER